MNILIENPASVGQPLHFASQCKASGFASPAQLLAALKDALPDERLAALAVVLAPEGLTKLALGAVWHGTRPAPALLCDELASLAHRVPEGSRVPTCQPDAMPVSTMPMPKQEPPAGAFPPPPELKLGAIDMSPADATRALLKALGREFPGGKLWVTSFREYPETDAEKYLRWAGHPIDCDPSEHDIGELSRLGNNNYVKRGVFRADARGSGTAALAGFSCIVFDDVGTAVPWPSVDPDWALLTSPGNYQVGFLIEKEEGPAGIERVKKFYKAARGKLSDAGASAAQLYVRLPGRNTKPEYGPDGAQVEFHRLKLDAPRKLDDLAAQLGVAVGFGAGVDASKLDVGASQLDVGVAELSVSAPVSAGHLAPKPLLAPGANDQERGKLVARMLTCIANDERFENRPEWIEVLHAAHGACNGDPAGCEAFVDWSHGDPAEAERVWETCKGSDIRGYPRLMEWLAEDAREVAGQSPLPGDETDAQRQHRERAAALHRQIRFEHAVAVFTNAPAVPDALLSAQGAVQGAGVTNPGPNRWDALEQALRRLESARTAPLFNAGGWKPKGGWSTFDDTDTSPPPVRPDITDLLARGEASMLVSAPGVGKSTLTALMASALSWVNRDLIGFTGRLDWLGDIVLVSNEDGPGTWDRKLKAIKRAHNLGKNGARPPHAIHLVNEMPLTLIEQVGGTIMPTEACIAFIDNLAAIRRDRDICLIVIDTLSSSMLGLDENSAAAMQAASNLLNSIARRGFLSMLVLHHTGKGASAEAPDAMSFRGSSALSGAFRMMALLRHVSAEEAKRFGWSEDERKRRIVLDGPAGKANDRPKAGQYFFRFDQHSILSTDPRNPGTPQSVPAAVLFHENPAPVVRATPAEAFALISARINAGQDVRHSAGNAGPLPKGADVQILMAELGLDRKEAQVLIDELIRQGYFAADKRTPDGGKNAVDLLILGHKSAPPDWSSGAAI